jgi:hypothetical protein
MKLTFKTLQRLQVIYKSDNEPFFKLFTHVGTDSTSVSFKLPCKYKIHRLRLEKVLASYHKETTSTSF